MPKVSVIVPCYNMGKYIDETIDSVLKSTFPDFEIVVVNDGSTDEFTNKHLADYNRPKTKVIHTKNQGLVGARNTAIENSSGEYILPLDSDDMISENYIKEAVEYMDNNPNAGIVYCMAERFGDSQGIWEFPEYSVEGMVQQCLIFCSGFFRRKDCEKVGGYSANMNYNYEDWDFWLKIIELERDVYRIPKIHFFNRVRKDSITSTRDWGGRMKTMNRQLYLNHLELFAKYHTDPVTLSSEIKKLKNEKEETIKWVYNTMDYKLGHALLKPFRFIKNLFKPS
jgi:glycosyltransferase involved in cell wall biosynthesis